MNPCTRPEQEFVLPEQPQHKVTAYGTVTPPHDQPDGAEESADENDKE